jgi:hypothetical protein
MLTRGDVSLSHCFSWGPFQFLIQYTYVLHFRLEKLKNVIRKTYSKFGKLVNEHYPLDSEGKTKGTDQLLF